MTGVDLFRYGLSPWLTPGFLQLPPLSSRQSRLRRGGSAGDAPEAGVADSEGEAYDMKRRVFRAALFGFLGAVIWQQGAVAQTVHYVDNIRTCDGLTPCYSLGPHHEQQHRQPDSGQHVDRERGLRYQRP